ncbi:LysE family translocator [Pedobacter cryophilus]|uniref:LysE family translocator n=1 Tax=Pedobacter cryophilus TaxID=2571271 RepID=A0A4U1C169_9SPHI|nr:LysE family transporter [Pedobacter cryophilus]TKB98961.1 LysE family translocator [Pedobacter cryophilus]
MLELIVYGIGLGIVLSFLTGPVFFALIKTSIEKGFYAGVALASGVVISDLVYVVITLFGTTLLSFESTYRIPIGIMGSVVLMSIGLYYLLKKVKINYDEIPSKTKHAGYFLKGFFMCIFNPFLLLYWVSVTSGVYSVYGNLTSREVIPFFGAILITLFGMDTLKAYLSHRMRYKIKEKTIQNLNKIAGVLIIVFALKLIYNLIFSDTLI